MTHSDNITGQGVSLHCTAQTHPNKSILIPTLNCSRTVLPAWLVLGNGLSNVHHRNYAPLDNVAFPQVHQVSADHIDDHLVHNSGRGHVQEQIRRNHRNSTRVAGEQSKERALLTGEIFD